MDAEKIVADLKTILDGMEYNDWPNEAKTVREAIAFIEDQTEPLTLDECRDILNANRYVFERSWDDAKPWIVVDSSVFGQVLVMGTTWLTLFEAQCLARGFLAQGGAK